MLEEVGEAGPAGLLVLRADLVPQVHADERGGVVLVKDHVQAVGQGESLDLEVGDGPGLVLGPADTGKGRSDDEDGDRREGESHRETMHGRVLPQK